MSDVNETLQQLLTRRLREIGRTRGRDTPISLNQAYASIPERLPSGEAPVTYELVRRVSKGTHTNLSGRAVRTLATMLGVPEGDVWQAAGRRAPAGRFELPERADRLSDVERAVVLSVVDAILNAGEAPRRDEDAVESGAFMMLPGQTPVPLGGGQQPPTDAQREQPGRRSR